MGLLLMGGLSSPCTAAAAEDRLAYQLAHEPTRLNLNPILMRERSDELLEYAIEHKNCDSLHLANFLAMQANAVMGEAYDPKPFDLPWACKWRHGPLFYVRGVLRYNANDLFGAASDFRSAASASALAEANDHQVFALHALGSVEMNRRNYAEALDVFEQAYALDPDYHLPTHLNNLAYASFIVGDCKSANQWCDLAMDVLARKSKELPEAYFEGDRNVILLTRLLVALAQSDVAEMQSIIDQIDFLDSFAGREMVAIAAVTQALQATNRPRVFEALRGTFESWLTDMDSTAIAAEFGANKHLLAPWHPASEPIPAAEWNELRRLPSALRGLPQVSCRDAVVSASQATSGGSGLWDWQRLTWALCLFALLGLGFVISEFRFARALKATFDAVPAAQRAILDQTLYLPTSKSSLLRGRALIALRMLRVQKELSALKDEDLSGEERFAVVRLRAGERPDSVARQAGLSRRAVKSLGERFGILVWIVLLSWGASTSVSTAAATLPADSAWAWLERGDSTAWFSALEAGTEVLPDASIPEAVTCAFLSDADKPAWCILDDVRLWQELRYSFVILEDERLIQEGIAQANLNPEVHVAFWQEEESSAWRRRFGWASAAMILFVGSGSVFFFRNRSLLRSIPEDIKAVDEAWGQGDGALNEEALKSLRIHGAEGSKAKGVWSLLNASEQEVAIYLAEGLTVATIADRMSCTTRYIYNIRSSIRKKWDLDADADLIEAIRLNQPPN